MRKRGAVLVAAVGLVVGMAASAIAGSDFGLERDGLLTAKSRQQFGVVEPVPASSTSSVTAGQAEADPASLATFAKGLNVRVVTSGVAAANVDMMALWPNDADPQWLIACNEQGSSDPGLQRIDIATGEVETILTGTESCDPVRRTPWGTIVFAEEAGGGPNGGRLYELLDPIGTTGVTLNRATGTASGGVGAANVVARPALGRLSYEGLAVYPSGLVYYGDENRPSTGAAGGAYFKFVPASLRNENAGDITDLSQSPLASGSVFGLRLGKRSGGTDYGQGSNTGLGTWVPIPASPDPDLRAQAAALKLTGYYRPEDIDIDGRAEADGLIRFCGNNTGNEAADHNWGETICITDRTPAQAGQNAAPPEVQFLQVGSSDMAMVDNVAYQPGRGDWVLLEDGDISDTGKNNDLWDCLPDGADADTLTDGCIRIGTLNDLTANGGEGAEWTGGVFDATGTRFFVSVQHNVTGQGVVLEVTGWK
jgi:secreted PhoX family phosphatase